MKVEKFFPVVELTPFVREFMIIESDWEVDSKIIPYTSVIMAFRYKGEVIMMEGEAREVISPAVITGLRRSARLLHYAKKTANLLVIFNEGGIAAFSRIPAHELFGLSVSSENLFPPAELNEILERLAEARTNRDRVAIIETVLQKKLIDGRVNPIIDEAIRIIKRHNGMIPIKDLAASLHISQDPFEKKFRALVGSTPKQYASIIRLRTLIKKYPSYSSLTEASYEAGYFDQSHFIKDFRLFTGQTPTDFFKSPLFW